MNNSIHSSKNYPQTEIILRYDTAISITREHHGDKYKVILTQGTEDKRYRSFIWIDSPLKFVSAENELIEVWRMRKGFSKENLSKYISKK